MLAKLGAPPTISAKDMLVEQELNKSIRVYFLKTETDDEYNARILALQTQAAADAKIAQKANEENIHWQKFLQLAEKFKDRVDLTILDKKPADLTIKK
jgi:hypothetical protein